MPGKSVGPLCRTWVAGVPACRWLSIPLKIKITPAMLFQEGLFLLLPFGSLSVKLLLIPGVTIQPNKGFTLLLV